MFLMIINLLRVRPAVFNSQLKLFKSKYDQNKRDDSSGTLSIDIESAINLLENHH